MSIVTIPAWLLLTAAGIPTLCGLFLAWGLVRLRRKSRSAEIKRPAASRDETSNGFCGKIHHHILDQQIDAVFNALLAVIETERTKLKALAFQTLPPEVVPTSKFDLEAGESSCLSGDEAAHGQDPIGRHIAACAADGMQPHEIAHRLGLSQAEVALAMKMNPEVGVEPRIKLEAVA